MTRKTFIAAALGLAAVLPAIPAQATSLTRTFVSSAGHDSNPCTITQPCATFARAYSLTAASGIIAALDPGKYGPLTITGPVTINGYGWAAITGPASGNAITINAGLADKIILIGLEIDGANALNTIGIEFNSGGSLTVRDSAIQNFTRYGILFQPNDFAKISVSNTHVSDNNYGIYIGPLGPGTTDGALDHVHTDDNTNDGITVIRGNGQILIVVVADSVSANNGGNGVIATAVDGLTVRNSTITGNGGTGLAAFSGATIVVTRSTISGNHNFGWSIDANSLVRTYADNSNDFNLGGTSNGQTIDPYK